MDEPPRLYAKGKKLDPKDHLLYDLIHTKYPEEVIPRDKTQIGGCQGLRTVA